MRLLIISYLFFVFGWVNAQSDTLNFTDENGKKQGYWIIYGKDKKNPNYCDSCVIEEGNYNDNRKNGIWKNYYPNGNIKSELEYLNNRPNGIFKTYYENGQIEEEGNWKGTYYIGLSKLYWENGCLKRLHNYDKDEKKRYTIYYYQSDTCNLVYQEINVDSSGKEIIFTRKGDIISSKEKVFIQSYSKTRSFSSEEELCLCSVSVSDTIYSYQKDSYNITLHGYFSDGKIFNGWCKINEISQYKTAAKEFKIVDGKILTFRSGGGKLIEKEIGMREITDGYYKFYNENKQIIQDGEFKNGKLWNGKFYIYDRIGLLLAVEIYKNGKYVGDAQLD